MEKDHLAKLAPVSKWGAEICILILEGSKIMNSKAPNLEELLQTLTSLWGALSSSLHLSRPLGRERCKEEDKARLAMKKDDWLTSVWIQECVDWAQEAHPDLG
jgi:hypothetical protein